jgi:hypothetical protein
MMRICRELGYTLSELTQRLSHEEFQLWALIYQVEEEERIAASKKNKRR